MEEELEYQRHVIAIQKKLCQEFEFENIYAKRQDFVSVIAGT